MCGREGLYICLQTYVAHCPPSACVQIWYWSLTGNEENKAHGWSEQKNANNRSDSQWHEGGSREMHRHGSCLRVCLCACMCACVCVYVSVYVLACVVRLHLSASICLSFSRRSFSLSFRPPLLYLSLSVCLSVSSHSLYLSLSFSLSLSLSLAACVCRIGKRLKNGSGEQ